MSQQDNLILDTPILQTLKKDKLLSAYCSNDGICLGKGRNIVVKGENTNKQYFLLFSDIFHSHFYWVILF